MPTRGEEKREEEKRLAKERKERQKKQKMSEQRLPTPPDEGDEDVYFAGRQPDPKGKQPVVSS